MWMFNHNLYLFAWFSLYTAGYSQNAMSSRGSTMTSGGATRHGRNHPCYWQPQRLGIWGFCYFDFKTDLCVFLVLLERYFLHQLQHHVARQQFDYGVYLPWTHVPLHGAGCGAGWLKYQTQKTIFSNIEVLSFIYMVNCMHKLNIHFICDRILYENGWFWFTLLISGICF